MKYLTTFPAYQLEIYKEAVRTWIHGRDFGIDGPCDYNPFKGRTTDGTLAYYGDDRDLSEFWAHFTRVKNKWKDRYEG